MIKSKKLSSLVAASLILAGGSFLGVQTVSADDATRLAAVEALASQNHSSISELTEKVNKISTTPEQLQQIDTNKDNITKNQTAIQTNADAIKKNSEDIATNKADIATNKADIATNKSDIATNKADIAQEVKNRTKAVADEAAARESGDNALQSQIKKESAARQADISRLDNKIHDVSKEVDTVGALSMAMSGLHPLSYDEGDARFQLSAAVGTYDGTEALALGGFYHFNRDSMLSVGVATDLGADEHRMGANVGYTRRIGQGGHVSRPSEGTVSDIMKDIKNLEQKQAKLEQENEQLKQQLAALKK
ncbi:YadA-like family protein [Dialister succinatiphilus]|uniref:YadA-like family protein n=1 Tax=Dialister succinatiphilus TaxID=487173 RepID=UPI003AB48B55